MLKSTQLAVLKYGAVGFFLIILQGLIVPAAPAATASLATVNSHLGPRELAVIVNNDDPLSVRIGEYYQAMRHIPDANMIHIRFRPGSATMSPTEFRALDARVDALTPHNIQAYALTWTSPYRVGCMSITTAFAAGFHQAYCASGCQATQYDPYFDSPSHTPYTDFRIRPTMALAGRDFEDVKRLIDRGVASDGTFPHGTGYLLSTSDPARNVRATMYPAIVSELGNKVRLRIIRANYIADRKHVLFYFTGVVRVRALRSNHFLPGAIADHLTSLGGVLIHSSQMSSLKWLEAGATGSYGTVVEPCNLPDKFPSPGVVIRFYLKGESLIEAYWKSVAMPGQGIFIGEPLAAPYSRRPPAY
ncbi:MAG: TIGR03790 family protein [Acidobacteriaceae bacterium]